MTYEEAKMQIQAIPEKIWDQLSEPDREAMEMAFSALQAQEAKTQLSAEGTTSDLISRQAAIDAVEYITSSMSVCANTDECHGMKRMQRQAVIELANLQSAQPEPHWIPISERLPKLDEAVLVTTEWNDLSIAWRTGIDKWYIHEGNTNSTTDDLTAWMHLPKPYKAERKNNV